MMIYLPRDAYTGMHLAIEILSVRSSLRYMIPPIADIPISY